MADIGGAAVLRVVITVYLVGSVVAATAVNPLLMRFGPRVSYLLILSVFGAGTLGCALAPTMELLLVARTVQGAAGGMLAGLGYAVISAALPQWLWTRASALVSAMWGSASSWVPPWAACSPIRDLALGLRVVDHDSGDSAGARRVTGPAGRRTCAPSDFAGSVWSLLLLGAAALAISVAGLQDSPSATVGLLAAGVAMVAGFVVVDRRARAAVLPRAAFGPVR